MTQWQTTTNNILVKTNTLSITTHNCDSVYFGIIFDIDIFNPKQSKTAITSINKSNSETFTVIGALVVDICQRTQTEKTLLDNFLNGCLPAVFDKHNVFEFVLVTYINNESIYDTINFTI